MYTGFVMFNFHLVRPFMYFLRYTELLMLKRTLVKVKSVKLILQNLCFSSRLVTR